MFTDVNVCMHSPSITLILFFPAVLNGVEYSSLIFGSAPACNSNFIALEGNKKNGTFYIHQADLEESCMQIFEGRRS